MTDSCATCSKRRRAGSHFCSESCQWAHTKAVEKYYNPSRDAASAYLAIGPETDVAKLLRNPQLREHVKIYERADGSFALPRRFALRVAAQLIGPKVPLTGAEEPPRKRVDVKELSAAELENLILAAREEKLRREEAAKREEEERIQREEQERIRREEKARLEEERIRRETAKLEQEKLRREDEQRQERARREVAEKAEKARLEGGYTLAKHRDLMPKSRWTHDTAVFEHYATRLPNGPHLSAFSDCAKEGSRRQFGKIAFQKEGDSVATLKRFKHSRVMKHLRKSLHEFTGVKYNFALVKCDVATGVWHSDDDPQIDQKYPIATIGFTRGAARKFKVGIKGSATTSAVFVLDGGDLMIMGGDKCQQLTEHAEQDEPGTTRIQIMFFMIKKVVPVPEKPRPPVQPSAPVAMPSSSSGFAEMFTLVTKDKARPIARWTYKTAIFEQAATAENFLDALWLLQPQAAPVSWTRFAEVFYTEDRKTLEFGSSAKPFEREMEVLLRRVRESVGVQYNSALATFYTAKGSYEWHSESDPQIDQNYPITILTFCSHACELFARARDDHSLNTRFVLDNGHIVVMGGADCQRLTQHTVPKRMGLPADFKRIHISFRMLRMQQAPRRALPSVSLPPAPLLPGPPLPLPKLGPPPSLRAAEAAGAAALIPTPAESRAPPSDPLLQRREAALNRAHALFGDDPRLARELAMALQTIRSADTPEKMDRAEELLTTLYRQSTAELAATVDPWEFSSSSEGPSPLPVRREPSPDIFEYFEKPKLSAAQEAAAAAELPPSPVPVPSYAEQLRRLYESEEAHRSSSSSEEGPSPPTSQEEVVSLADVRRKIDRLRAEASFYKLMVERNKGTPDFEREQAKYEQARTDLAKAVDEARIIHEISERHELEDKTTSQLKNQLEALQHQVKVYSATRDMRHAYDVIQFQKKIELIVDILAERGEDIKTLDELKGMAFELDEKLFRVPVPTSVKDIDEYLALKDRLDLLNEQIEERGAEVRRAFLDELQGEVRALQREYAATMDRLPARIRAQIYLHGTLLKDARPEQGMRMYGLMLSGGQIEQKLQEYVRSVVSALDEIAEDHQHLAADISKYKSETHKITPDMLQTRRTRMAHRIRRTRAMEDLLPLPAESAPPPPPRQPAAKITAAMLEADNLIKQLSTSMPCQITVNSTGHIYYPLRVTAGYAMLDPRGDRVRDTGLDGSYMFVEGPGGETFTLRKEGDSVTIVRYPKNTDRHGRLLPSSAQMLRLPLSGKKIVDGITFALSDDRLQGACSVSSGEGCKLFRFNTRTLEVSSLAEYSLFTVRCMVFLSDSSLALLTSSGRLMVRKPDGNLKQLSTSLTNAISLARDAADRLFVARQQPGRLTVINSATGEVEAYKDYPDAIPQSVAVDRRSGNVYVLFDDGNLYCMMCQ